MIQIKKISLSIILSLIVYYSMNAQDGIVHGKIIAFENIPVEKAVIKIKKTDVFVLSDSLGFFSIKCKLKDKLSIKAAGFKTETVKIKSFTNSLIVKVDFGGSDKDYEEAISNGHMNKDELIYSTDYLDAESFEDSGYITVIEMIDGKFPGVRLAGDKFLIRGFTSFNGNNAALIIIDGMRSSMNSLESLSVHDVENIKVLKGTQAAIHGEGSANGVILVTTKSSKKRN